MVIDDIIAAFRSVQTDITKAMRQEYPPYSPETAQERIEFIESFLSRAKKNLDAATYLSESADTVISCDDWDDIMDEVLAYLGVADTDEFWQVLSKGL